MKRRCVTENGFSLIEALFATSIIMLIVWFTVLTLIDSSQTSWLRLDAQFDSQYQAQKALDRLSIELHKAVQQQSPATPSPVCSVDSISFVPQKPPKIHPTDPEPPEPPPVVYQLEPGGQLVRIQSGIREIIGQKITHFEPRCALGGLVTLSIAAEATSARGGFNRTKGWSITQQLFSEVLVNTHA